MIKFIKSVKEFFNCFTAYKGNIYLLYDKKYQVYFVSYIMTDKLKEKFEIILKN